MLEGPRLTRFVSSTSRPALFLGVVLAVVVVRSGLSAANSDTVASRRDVSCCASSPMMPMKRPRASWSISGKAAIVSTAARMLPSDARVPWVSVCSNRSRRCPASMRRVMSSSTSTKPLMAGVASAAASSADAITGAICTRTSWPDGAVVTKCATGSASPPCSRSCSVSRAWMIRLRSKTAKIERPSPSSVGIGSPLDAPCSGLRRRRIARGL